MASIGDVNTAADADAMRANTGCDGVMVARAAMRNPWALRAIAARGGAAGAGQAWSDNQRAGVQPSEAQVHAAAREHAAFTAHLPSAARYAVFHTPNFERLRRGAFEAELPRTRAAPTADAGREGGKRRARAGGTAVVSGTR